MDMPNPIPAIKKFLNFRMEGQRASFDLYRFVMLGVLIAIFSCIALIYERQEQSQIISDVRFQNQESINSTNQFMLAVMSQNLTDLKSDVSDIHRVLMMSPRQRQISLAVNETNRLTANAY